MNPSGPTPALSEAEWALLIELLQEERRELPAEIRRTETSHYKDQLAARLHMVDAVLKRLIEARQPAN
ncbi:MAG: hypothetical protein SFV54_06645 [Bryobacteraceae bacterium]|nr:hypothetical protein [Bryobacteraceae bacterium]